MFKVGDYVESLKTGKRGIIQASYPEGRFLLFTGTGYEHLFPEEMKAAATDEKVTTYLTNKSDENNQGVGRQSAV